MLRTPVYVMMQDMPYDEYVKWSMYFSYRPFGWREDDRTAKLMAAQGIKTADKLFPTLQRLREKQIQREELQEGQISVNNLKGSAFFLQMLGATSGDRLEILND